MTILLAIEASQRAGGVALRGRDGRVRVEGIGASRHDDELMPAIASLVDAAGLRPTDLEAVAVSIGPGGFTGLRLSIAAAKMLGLASGASLVAVPSAQVVAAAVGQEGGDGPILVTLASKRGTYWATRFARADDAWTPLEGDLGAGRLEDAATAPLDGLTAVVGDAHLPPALLERCTAAGLPVLEPRHDAAVLLQIAAEWLRGNRDDRTIDGDALLPLYPRAPEAVRRWAERKSRP